DQRNLLCRRHVMPFPHIAIVPVVHHPDTHEAILLKNACRVVVVGQRSRGNEDGWVCCTRYFHELTTNGRTDALMPKLRERSVSDFNASFERCALESS